ncbi:MAG: FtsX extracellular domain [Deltaproteobacteria bacterium]|nr:FtsX extracellular domain [Deltaproteobacteria bacterium]MBP2687243.1 FtsX extracellular domain [Deltaproteobacteria bacterium]
MSERPSLWWIDWRLSRGPLVRETIGRFLFFCLLGFVLLSLLLSGGVSRILASRYAITAVLHAEVPSAEAEGLARKAAALPPVRSATYRDPEAAWKEFLRAYPGLGPLRGAGENPLPGYIEIRIRPDRLTGEDIDLVASALRSVPLVEHVLAGEEWLPRLLRAGRLASWVGWGIFAVFLAGFFLVGRLQERARAIALESDFAFLAERGVPAGRLAVLRAAGAAISGFLLAAAGTATGGGALFLILRRFPFLEGGIGPPSDLLLPRTVAAAALFCCCAALLSAAASLLGWRVARPGRK